MVKVCVITACGNKKEAIPLPAWKIYRSTRIKAVYNRKCDCDMYILSAEHGLLPAEKIIKPYNRLMDEARAKELLPSIESVVKNYDKIVYFKPGARKLYEECLRTACEKNNVMFLPHGFGWNMGGIGELEDRINRAKGITVPANSSRPLTKNFSTDACGWLHSVLEKLPSIKYPFEIENLPDNGVYFFYEEGEQWGHDPNQSHARIVRVGTHKEGNFKSRMKDHYLFNESKMNFDRTKPAPHARSIFRQNLGRAILSKEKNEYLKIWNIDFTTRKKRDEFSHLRDIELEKKIEKKITSLLRENFSFKYLIVEGQEKRMGSKGIESKLIGTLSHCEKCKPSRNWLGNYSSVSKISSSGLWLYQHLSDPPISQSDKEEIQSMIKETQRYINT